VKDDGANTQPEIPFGPNNVSRARCRDRVKQLRKEMGLPERLRFEGPIRSDVDPSDRSWNE